MTRRRPRAARRNTGSGTAPPSTSMPDGRASSSGPIGREALDSGAFRCISSRSTGMGRMTACTPAGQSSGRAKAAIPDGNSCRSSAQTATVCPSCANCSARTACRRSPPIRASEAVGFIKNHLCVIVCRELPAGDRGQIQEKTPRAFVHRIGGSKCPERFLMRWVACRRAARAGSRARRAAFPDDN